MPAIGFAILAAAAVLAARTAVLAAVTGGGDNHVGVHCCVHCVYITASENKYTRV